MPTHPPIPPELDPDQIAESSEPPLCLGSCILRQSRCASIVQDAILHFHNDRYFLRAWCVMPNHVHVVMKPSTHSLASILHSWKSFTSNEINRVLNQNGVLWERESFNHLIRRPESVARFIAYTENNPVKAGLCATPSDWPFSSASVSFTSEDRGEFIDPRTTRFVSPYSRGELKHLHKPEGVYFITWRLLDAVELNQEK